MANQKTGNDVIDAKLEEWMRWDKNEKNCSELRQLATDKNVAELEKRLLHRMEFGTAGLRARMGAGYNMMNDLTIIQATQGLVKYLLKTVPDVKKNGMVVGYDARHNSYRWGEIVAAICIHQGVPVYRYSKINPTPYVPYAVLHYGASCGVMITASHNPKEDNGYKVYWTNGAQICSPTDRGIADSILENLQPLDSSWDTSCVGNSPLCRDPYDEIFTEYNKDLNHLCYFREDNKKSPVTFTYTAMHGVGYKFTNESMQRFGFPPPVPVPAQVEPDPEFPTVRYPNPEEGKGALTLSIQTAEDNNSKVILANDPDADRLAIAEKQANGEWKIFTGNEIGAFLGWWSFTTFQQHNPSVKASDICMVASTVSSKILQTIAEKEGAVFDETLTGFKWIANKAVDRLKEGKHVVFAFEEAIGFMCGTKVLDKDGVSAAAVAAELATHLYLNNSTLAQKLEEIYTKYGFHLSENSYFKCRDPNPAMIHKLFQNLRNFDGPGKYPASCGPYKIKYIRDLTDGYDNSQPNNVPILPVSKSSEMITFTFENGCVATLRMSGTEPKIKYYTEHKFNPSRGMDRQATQAELDDMVHCIVTHFLQPEAYRLIPRQTS